MAVRMGPRADSDPPRVGAVVMAAGAGRRMGGVPKALLRRDGEPLLLRQIRLAAEAAVGAIVVVLGHHAASLASVLEQARSASILPSCVIWATNPDPDRGTGSSLRCGLEALPADLSTWLVLLGDQPLLEAADVRAILEAWNRRAAGIELVSPEHAGQPGHPIAFGHTLREVMLSEHAGRGVREWRRAHPERVVMLPVSHVRCTTDIDVPADLETLQSQHGVCLEWPSDR